MTNYNTFNSANCKKIGMRIMEERKRLKLSQTALIATLEDMNLPSISRNTLSAIERGEEKGRSALHAIKLDQILGLCEVFGCSLGYLLGEYDGISLEQETAHEYTGLSYKALSILRKQENASFLDSFITNKRFNDIVHDAHHAKLIFEHWKKEPTHPNVELSNSEATIIAMLWRVSKRFSDMVEDFIEKRTQTTL